MNAEAAADTAVLVSAILMLLAITSKLVTASLVTRSKGAYTKLDARRRETVARMKEVQLKRTSARGTLEFWDRRRTETSQKVLDARRDMENYAAQFGPGESDEDEDAATGMDIELLEAPQDSADSGTDRTQDTLGAPHSEAAAAASAVAAGGDDEADSGGETDTEPDPEPRTGADDSNEAESSGASPR